MRRHGLALGALLGVLTASVAAAQAPGEVSVRLPSVGGWVLMPDNVTLIVSVPSAGELVYFDTTADKEAKRVDVEFKPAALALCKGKLVAAASGSNTIHILDAGTGKPLKKTKCPGDAVKDLAAHPEKGPVFVSDTDEVVYALDPEKGTIEKTAAHGQFLVVDPSGGEFLYTATNRPSRDFVEASRDGGRVRFQLVTVQETATVRKYKVGTKLQLVDGNANVGWGAGGALHVSPDGKKVAFAAGGGWKANNNERMNYCVAVFSAEDMSEMLGQVELGPYPQNIAVHPVLNLGVALKNNVELKFFKPSSLTDRGTAALQRREHTFWLNLLTFAGKGTRLVHLQGENLTFVPLKLSDEGRAELEKVYGELPPPTEAGVDPDESAAPAQ